MHLLLPPLRPFLSRSPQPSIPTPSPLAPPPPLPNPSRMPSAPLPPPPLSHPFLTPRPPPTPLLSPPLPPPPQHPSLLYVLPYPVGLPPLPTDLCPRQLIHTHTHQLSNLHRVADLIHNSNCLLNLFVKLRGLMSNPNSLDLGKIAKMHCKIEILYKEHNLRGR